MAEKEHPENDALTDAVSDVAEALGMERLPVNDRATLARILDVLAGSVKYGSFEATFHESAVVDVRLTTRVRPKR